jgi:hypothetical protein
MLRLIIIRFVTPVVLCFGIPRLRVYRLVLRLTQKALEDSDTAKCEQAASIFYTPC